MLYKHPEFYFNCCNWINEIKLLFYLLWRNKAHKFWNAFLNTFLSIIRYFCWIRQRFSHYSGDICNRQVTILFTKTRITFVSVSWTVFVWHVVQYQCINCQFAEELRPQKRVLVLWSNLVNIVWNNKENTILLILPFIILADPHCELFGNVSAHWSNTTS